jgi:hypothetical protein
MSNKGVVQFIYCCPENFAKKYRKLAKLLKKTECTIDSVNEEILKNHYSWYKTRCKFCRQREDPDGIKVTVKYEIYKPLFP